MHWQCKQKIVIMTLLPSPRPQIASDHLSISKGSPEMLSARTGFHCHVGVHLKNHIFVFIEE